MNQPDSTLENFVGIWVALCFERRLAVSCFFTLRMSWKAFWLWCDCLISIFPYCYFCRRFIIMSLLNVVCLFYLWLPIASTLISFYLCVAFISEVCTTTLSLLPMPLMPLLRLFIFFFFFSLFHNHLFVFAANLANALNCSFFFHLSLIGTCHHCRIAATAKEALFSLFHSRSILQLTRDRMKEAIIVCMLSVCRAL